MELDDVFERLVYGHGARAIERTMNIPASPLCTAACAHPAMDIACTGHPR